MTRYVFTCVLAAACCITCFASTACTVAQAEPFVAGFDRFHKNQSDAESGQLLLTELSCTACHAGPKSLAPKRGPNLDGAARRLDPRWLKQYLLNPQTVKPGGTMPSVLHQLPDSERDAAADALIAFLSGDPTPEPTVVSTASNPVAVEVWKKGDPAVGRQLYHRVGCVACHDPDREFQPEKVMLSDLQKRIEKLDLDPEELKELGLSTPQPVRSVPHGKLEGKYSLRSLAMFLIDPAKIRPGGRMPNLRLHPTEAANIASYLLNERSPSESPPIVASPDLALQAKQGAKLFQSLGCVQCHEVKGAIRKPGVAKPLSELNLESDANCMTTQRASLAPHFNVNQLQRDALAAAISEPTSDDPLRLTMQQLNCYACHQRDKLGGVGPQRYQFFETVGHVDVGDEGRIPPPLDFVGAKLTHQWLETVLSGKGNVRAHFRVRMPSFAMHHKSLASMLKSVDGQLDISASPIIPGDKAPEAQAPSWIESKPSASHIERGRALLNIGCVQCHPLWGEHLPGVIGVDIANLSQRIEPRWLHAFLLDPARLKPNTRMPTFFPNGKSTSKIYEGNIDRQISAMWHYLNAPKLELPDRLEQGKAHNFELTPTDEPIVLRTFMQGAGNHAIAVGFPERLHFVFDAKRVAIPYLWKGRFINAHSTWYDRFTPPAQALGSLMTLPHVTIVGVGEAPPASLPLNPADPPKAPALALDFRGYKLDKQRVPIMLYRSGPWRFEERLAPAGGKLRRRISVRFEGDAPSPDTTFWVAVASDAIRINGSGEAIIYPVGKVELPRHVEGKLRSRGTRNEYLAPLRTQNGQGNIEVLYQW